MTSRTERLCIEGVQAEFDRDLERARRCFLAAWQDARDAAANAWNENALRFAQRSGDERIGAFMPSLLVSLGRTHELLGDADLAGSFYERARALGLDHSPNLLRGPWLARARNA